MCFIVSTGFRRFEESYWLHLQGQQLFVPEDDGSIILRNLRNYWSKDTASQSRNMDDQQHCCENLQRITTSNFQVVRQTRLLDNLIAYLSGLIDLITPIIGIEYYKLLSS